MYAAEREVVAQAVRARHGGQIARRVTILSTPLHPLPGWNVGESHSGIRRRRWRKLKRSRPARSRFAH
jgi:hypothetical protein